MEFILRKAEIADLDGIMQVEKEGFIPQIQESREVFKKRIQLCPHLFLIFENPENHEVAGYLSAELLEKLPETADEIRLGHAPNTIKTIYSVPFVCKLYISSFSIRPFYRGHGTGKLLWNKSLDFISKSCSNFDQFVLLVNEQWAGARHIYEQSGFAYVKRFENFFPDVNDSYTDGFLMTKKR